MENPTCREKSLGLNSDGHTDRVTGRQVHMRARGAETTAATGWGGVVALGASPLLCVLRGPRCSRCRAGVTWHWAPGLGVRPRACLEWAPQGVHGCSLLMPRPALWTQGAGP